MRVFITGTDTDAGKTVACAWLCLHSGADYWKPVQSGHPPDRDADAVARLSGARIHPERHLLKAPLSPAEAAGLEDMEISLDDFSAPQTSRPLVMEGAGGVLVPLNARHTMLDLMERLRAPVIVVGRSGLGTINHTCLTLQALRQRHLPVLGVILCGEPNPANRAAIEHFGDTRVLAEIPRLEKLSRTSLEAVPASPEVLEWIRWKP